MKARVRLEHLPTPEGEPIPPNTLAELRRDMRRKQFVAEQIRQIERARLERLVPGIISSCYEAKAQSQ
jgi:transposase